MSLIPTLDGGIWGLSRLVNLNIKFYCLFPGEIFPFKEIHQINPNNLIGCVITAHHTNWLHVRLVGTIWLILCVCFCTGSFPGCDLCLFSMSCRICLFDSLVISEFKEELSWERLKNMMFNLFNENSLCNTFEETLGKLQSNIMLFKFDSLNPPAVKIHHFKSWK